MNHIAHLGGKIALDLISDSSPSLKKDNSVLTKADTAVSKFVYSALSDLLATSDHILIDEENIKNMECFDQSKFVEPVAMVLNRFNKTIK